MVCWTCLAYPSLVSLTQHLQSSISLCSVLNLTLYKARSTMCVSVCHCQSQTPLHVQFLLRANVVLNCQPFFVIFVLFRVFSRFFVGFRGFQQFFVVCSAFYVFDGFSRFLAIFHGFLQLFSTLYSTTNQSRNINV